MAKAKNMVIAGDYEGKGLTNLGDDVVIVCGFKLSSAININSSTVESYEVITDEQRKSAASGVARGLVGGVLLGPVGLLAGGLSAKNKGIYQLAIQFKDNKRSLIEIDDKLYKLIIKSCFR